MTFVLSAVAFLFLLTLLVIVHELGHFWVAKWSGVTVEEFGFGLPPRVKTLFLWGGTRFSFNGIPFGGFVRLQGENSMDPHERVRRGSFAAAPVGSRLLILLAGVFMNFVVAFLLFMFGFWLWQWVPTYLTVDALREGEARREVVAEWGLLVSRVIEGSHAEAAGVAGEEILRAVDGNPVTTVEAVLALQAAALERNARSRSGVADGASVEYTLLSGENFDGERTVVVPVGGDGRTGVALSEFAFRIHGMAQPLFTGARLALRETWVATVGTLRGVSLLFSSLVREQRIPEDIAGIVGIAQLTHSSLQEGVMTYLRLIALLSLSLAVLNVLPFPALDGGRVAFVLYEMVMGSPVNRRFEVLTNGAGILFLVALMVAVTWNDILRILSTTSS